MATVPLTAQQNQRYQDYNDWINKNLSYGGYDNSRTQLLASLGDAQKYGVDPAQIEQFMNTAKGYAGAKIDASGVDSGLQSANNQFRNFLQMPGESYRENQQIDAQRTQQKQQSQQLQQDLLSQLPGIEDQVGKSLLNQQNLAYQQIQPLIEQRLNAMGILQSGALPEAQARAFKELETARQGRLADFDINNRQMLNFQMPLNAMQGDMGLAQQGMQNNFDLSRAGIQRQFQEQDVAQQMAMQQQMQNQALEEARAARRQQSQDMLNNSLIQGGFQLAGSGLKAGAAGPMMSDVRLKKNLERNGEFHGLPVYTFEYRTEDFPALDLPAGVQHGFLAHDVEKVFPEAVFEKHGFKGVRYDYILSRGA